MRIGSIKDGEVFGFGRLSQDCGNDLIGNIVRLVSG